MEKHLVTSALPYVNNIPHLGNLIGSTLSADVFARHKRLQGHDVLYVCGADEHGTMTEIKAKEEGLTPKQLCDKYGAIHKQIYEWFEISFDVWGRTHTDTQIDITQDIFTKLHENGYVKEKEVEQLYDEKAQQYLSDRFVEGTCPECGSEGARGDQCDACQALIHAPDLIEPVSKLTGTTPVVKRTKHLFIDLPALKQRLEPWVKQQEATWSKNTVTTTRDWLNGIQERAITRDLKWGVPVPLEGYEDKVFYVWFDAPIGYISITAHDREDWKEWWQADDVTLTQFMGKDNIVFHSVIFPATLLGTDDPWTLVDTINTTEFLNMERGKFSKSKNEGIFGDDCIRLEKEHGIRADVWRYYLVATRPETADATFSWKDFQARTNNELIANLGNLVHRTLHFADTKLDGKAEIDPEQWATVRQHIEEASEKVREAYDRSHLRKGLAEAMKLAKDLNAHFQEQAPWKTIKEAPEKAAGTIAVLLNALRDVATLISPVLPDTATRIHHMLGVEQQTYDDIGALDKDIISSITTPEILFDKLEDELITMLEEEFSPKTDLDLRVAKIIEAKDHPNADKLYVLQIDLGDEKRQLVAGLKQHYEPGDLEGKHIIVVANLKPAKLRGEKSEGMLLASEDEEGTVGLLLPDAEPGTLLTVGGARAEEEITIEEFFAHDAKAAPEGILIDGVPVQGADITVDKESYGTVR